MARCFVLGAGFSKACGLPLARELTKLVFAKAYGWFKDGGFGSETRERYMRFLRHLYPQLNFGRNWPDFEDLITVLDEWAEWQKAYEGRDRSDEVPTAGHLKKTLLKSVEELLCERAAAAPREGWELIERFVRDRYRDGDSIISFNWDTLIEVACHNQGIPVHYKQSGSPGLSVAKPHGSLNLAETTTAEWQSYRQRANVHSLTVEWSDTNTVAVRAMNPTDSHLRVVGPFPRTTMIEPSARKVYRSPWINLQWAHAYRIMQRAHDVYVIGFSLPPTDYRPRIMFQVAAMDRDPPPIVHIIAPNAKRLANRYGEVVNLEIQPVQASWVDWMVGLAKDQGMLSLVKGWMRRVLCRPR